MTIFDRLFRKKSKEPSHEGMRDSVGIAKDLFVEHRDPEEILGDLSPAKEEEQVTVLEDLLSKDYFTTGQKVGYEDHHPEVLEEQLDLIASTFRQAYYREKAATLERIDTYRLELSSKTKEIMPYQYARIEKKVEQEQRRLEDIQIQIDLAACGEGYIEQSVRQFKAGFRKGYSLWLDEEIVFKERKLL